MGGKVSGMTRAAWSGRGDRNGASSGNDDASDAREGVYGVGLLVVREGEVAAVTDAGGRRSMVEGPQSLRPGWGAHVAFLQRTQCDGLNYLRVSFVDGRVQHLRGPASVFVDPVMHKSVTIAPVLKLEGNEAIVVYADLSPSPDGAKESAKGGAGAGSGAGVQRRVVRGPVVFVPSEREWIHEFSWHGTRLDNGKGSVTGYHNDRKSPHAVNFTRVRMTSDHMYLTTRDVRSKDDATVDLHVMIFFRCVDLERMLMNTNDTTSDIINGAAADLQQYGSQRTYEQLLADSGALSMMEHYPILAARLVSIGYDLEKVVYRGYSSSDKLQSMQDSSIASRTKLRLDADTKRHEMANQMMELSARQERQKIEHEQDEARALHETKMRALRARAEQEERDELHQQHVRHQAEEHRVELEHARAKNREQLTYLDGLRAMGVDLSAYLVAKDGNKADYQILCGGAPGGQMPQLHLDVPRPA